MNISVPHKASPVPRVAFDLLLAAPRRRSRRFTLLVVVWVLLAALTAMSVFSFVSASAERASATQRLDEELVRETTTEALIRERTGGSGLPLPEIESHISSRAGLAGAALRAEPDVSGLVTTLSRALPPSVKMSSVSVGSTPQMTEDGEASTTPDGQTTSDDPSAVTVVMTASSLTDVRAVESVLERLALIADPEVTWSGSVTTGDTSPLTITVKGTLPERAEVPRDVELREQLLGGGS